jgi:phosphohistidine swiveling domain-containing protein
VLGHTTANTRQRDTMHFELTRLFPPFRALLLELGRRWAEKGVLSEAGDVFFLKLDEIKAAIGSDAALGELVAARRREHEANSRQAPPAIIRDGQELWSVTEVEQPSDAAAELRGVAGGPGRVSGVVRVVRGPEEFDKLAEGEILVAPLTNPVWTPLFAIAGGLVTEVGGILSHGAIVAREYGIPAVMAVAGATSRLRDGDRVTVDGGRGVVTVEEPVSEAVVAPVAATVAEPA